MNILASIFSFLRRGINKTVSKKMNYVMNKSRLEFKSFFRLLFQKLHLYVELSLLL